MYKQTAIDIDSMFKLRLNLTLYPTFFRYFLISSQLWLETIYLIGEDMEEVWTTKSSSFSKPITHLLNTSIIRYMLFKLRSYSIFIKILDKAIYIFISLKRVLPI